MLPQDASQIEIKDAELQPGVSGTLIRLPSPSMALTSDQTSAWTDSSFVLATSPSPGRARLQEGDIMTLFPGPSRDVEAWHFDATDAPVTNDTHLDLDSNGTYFGALNDSSFEAGEANGTDDYDYDYEIALETFFWRELTPTLVVYAVTYVLGVVGNALIIFTIYRYRRLKTTTNVFLASLATADLLLILMCIPVKVSADIRTLLLSIYLYAHFR